MTPLMSTDQAGGGYAAMRSTKEIYRIRGNQPAHLLTCQLKGSPGKIATASGLQSPVAC